MSKLYRFEVETLWIHPEINFSKRREMVYDFTTDELIADERTWFNGQDFYDPKQSPHIYADWEKAELAYTNLDWLMEEWKPLADLMQEGSNERIEAFRLIAVDENGNEDVVAENNLLTDLIAINEGSQQVQTA
ncbi:MAG: hypothetical protein FWC50_08315 [Planctomycetaceae bacterium]|nr:hypothetical protein [Planctomycetaceae bacterium]